MDSDASTNLVTPSSRNLTSAIERLSPILLIAGAVVALDQASKAAIRGWLSLGETWPGDFDLIRLTHVENSGAAFGILQDAGLFLLLASIVAVVLIAGYLIWSPIEGWIPTAALALILGGALGNLIDRWARGTVTDFIDPTHYPAFNLADSSIVVGVAALVLLSIFEPPDEEPSDGASRGDAP
jgi:signal peptidase II